MCPGGKKFTHARKREVSRIRTSRYSVRSRIAALFWGLKFSFSNRTVRDLMAGENIASKPLGNQIFDASLTPSSGLLTPYPVIEERTVRQMGKSLICKSICTRTFTNSEDCVMIARRNNDLLYGYGNSKAAALRTW